MPESTKIDAKRPPPKALDWVLKIVSDVRRGEGLTALVLAGNAFLLLFGYYLIKTIREPLVLLAGDELASGPAVKSYSAAGQAIALIVVAKIFDLVARRINRVKLMSVVVVFFVTNLLVFYLLAKIHAPIGI